MKQPILIIADAPHPSIHELHIVKERGIVISEPEPIPFVNHHKEMWIETYASETKRYNTKHRNNKKFNKQKVRAKNKASRKARKLTP